MALLAGLSAGWITFVNTFKHEHLHIPHFQLGQGAHAVAFHGFSFTPEARHTWPAFIALVMLLLVDVQLAPVRDYDRRAAADKAIADRLEQSTERLRQSNSRLRQILRSYELSNSSKASTKQFLQSVIQELSESRLPEDLNS